ncbi:hypothetical protein BYT27DRAFT_7208225 [Phlegmacium glaucopus]|nr:hypothetical protein BYT27DRAFT_7208225 [Phlegmacium glaucopus]
MSTSPAVNNIGPANDIVSPSVAVDPISCVVNDAGEAELVNDTPSGITLAAPSVPFSVSSTGSDATVEESMTMSATLPSPSVAEVVITLMSSPTGADATVEESMATSATLPSPSVTEAALKYLCRAHPGDRWVSLLKAWVIFEEYAVADGKFPVKDRPDEVAQWMKYDANWNAVALGGENGMFLVILTLAWWAQGVGVESTLQDFETAIEDVLVWQGETQPGVKHNQAQADSGTTLHKCPVKPNEKVNEKYYEQLLMRSPVNTNEKPNEKPNEK